MTDDRITQTYDYKPPRTKLGWERLEKELRQADERIVHYLHASKAAQDMIREKLRSLDPTDPRDGELAAWLNRLLTALAGRG